MRVEGKAERITEGFDTMLLVKGVKQVSYTARYNF